MQERRNCPCYLSLCPQLYSALLPGRHFLLREEELRPALRLETQYQACQGKTSTEPSPMIPVAHLERQTELLELW